jgi:hypothetical protein
MKKTNHAGLVRYQTKLMKPHFFGPVPDWNYKCRKIPMPALVCSISMLSYVIDHKKQTDI